MITEKMFVRGIALLFLSIVLGLLIYTGFVPDEKTEITDTFQLAIDRGHFPHYQLADSLCGIDSRGTDAWCETASCDCKP